MNNKKSQLSDSALEASQDIEKNKKISREAIEQSHALFRASLEKLKEYGVKERLLEPEIPLEQVRPKLLERIKELNERRDQRRVEDGRTLENERRELKDRRQP